MAGENSASKPARTDAAHAALTAGCLAVVSSIGLILAGVVVLSSSRCAAGQSAHGGCAVAAIAAPGAGLGWALIGGGTGWLALFWLMKLAPTPWQRRRARSAAQGSRAAVSMPGPTPPASAVSRRHEGVRVPTKTLTRPAGVKTLPRYGTYPFHLSPVSSGAWTGAAALEDCRVRVWVSVKAVTPAGTPVSLSRCCQWGHLTPGQAAAHARAVKLRIQTEGH